MVENLQKRFARYIKEKNLFTPEDKILLTVSGGVDSMVMLTLCEALNYNIGVAHCNFSLREKESDEDEVMVEEYCKKLKVPFFNMRFATKQEMERTGESVQMAARRLRYDWFERLALEEGYNIIAIAHHADDSIETFFINLFRGTGLKGLTGITKMRGKVVRPMLFTSRKEILEYAHENKVEYREDSSNRSTKYLRNKIRLGLIPRIREINPKFTELMGNNIQRLSDAQHFIQTSIERLRAQILTTSSTQNIIDPSLIDDDYPVGFVIYEILSSYGFKGDVVESLVRSIEQQNSGKKFYSKENVAYIDRGKIIIEPIEEDDPCECLLAEFSTKIYCGNSMIYVEKLDIDEIESLNVADNVALLDLEKLSFPLTARRWAEGDNFIPLGLTGHKKVSDMLIDAKVSVSEKKRQFVLCNGEEIVWLIGRRINEKYKITKQTEYVLRLTQEVV